MSWTLVGSVVTAGDAGFGSTLAFAAQNHTTGSDIVVGAGCNDAGGATGITSVTDTAGNTYTYAGVQANAGQNMVRFYYAYNITGHATNVVTITYNTTALYRNGVLSEWTPPASNNPLNDADTANGNSTAPTLPSLSVANSDALALSYQMAIGDSNVAGSGYTMTAFAITGDVIAYWGFQYKAISAAEAPSSTCGTGLWGIIGMTFSASVNPSSAAPGRGFLIL